jgi:hypothetical protein
VKKRILYLENNAHLIERFGEGLPKYLQLNRNPREAMICIDVATSIEDMRRFDLRQYDALVIGYRSASKISLDVIPEVRQAGFDKPILVMTEDSSRAKSPEIAVRAALGQPLEQMNVMAVKVPHHVPGLNACLQGLIGGRAREGTSRQPGMGIG